MDLEKHHPDFLPSSVQKFLVKSRGFTTEYLVFTNQGETRSSGESTLPCQRTYKRTLCQDKEWCRAQPVGSDPAQPHWFRLITGPSQRPQVEHLDLAFGLALYVYHNHIRQASRPQTKGNFWSSLQSYKGSRHRESSWKLAMRTSMPVGDAVMAAKPG